MYHKYKDQGLEVVCVSFERPENVGKWREIVERDGTDWINVSNVKAFNCPIYSEYMFNGASNQLVIDREGRIVLRNGTDEELEAKIKELL